MFKKLTLVAGFGAGYVLGAKAGTERYNQIQQKFQEFTGKPAVQNATSTVKETATGVAGTAKQTINEKVSSTKSSSTSSTAGSPDVVVDLGPSTTATPAVTTPPSTVKTTTTTSATPVVTPKPISGASASETTSDINRV